jgi:hypothetical protein
LGLFFVFSSQAVIQAAPSSQQTSIEVVRDEVWIDFPESADFHLQATSGSTIVSAELRYGVEGLSCGEVTAVTPLTFAPTTNLDLTWRWPIIESQLVPPGSKIWWQWQLETADNQQTLTPKQTITYLDSWFVWQDISQDNLTVHWYRGPNNIGQEMLAAGLTAVDQLAVDTGLRLTESIDLYLYDEPFDLRISLPGAPSWVGGAAFPERNVVLAVANKDYLDYGADTVKHEIGHLVTERLTFNCIGRLPTWLNEGLAMVAEGGEDENALETLAEAITNGSIITIPQLEGSFSVHTDRARLSYAQSYSLVRYLIDTYGQEQMLALLETFQQGTTADSALTAVYQLTTHTLEDEWRQAIGASPRPQIEGAANTASTAVPTAALLTVVTAVPTAMPATATIHAPPTAAHTASPPTAAPATETAVMTQPVAPSATSQNLPTTIPHVPPSTTTESIPNNSFALYSILGTITLFIIGFMIISYLRKNG